MLFNGHAKTFRYILYYIYTTVAGSFNCSYHTTSNKYHISYLILIQGLLHKHVIQYVDASTDERNPLVWISFILTAFHARNHTDDG